MTKNELKYIMKALEESRSPSVEATIYDLAPDGLGRVELVSTKEAARLLESDDYRKGWESCHSLLRDHLSALASMTPEQLRLRVKG